MSDPSSTTRSPAAVGPDCATALGPWSAPEPAAPPLRPRRRVPAPLSLEDGPDWSALEPRGFWARGGHWLLDGPLLAVALPLALLFGLPVALANWLAFGHPGKILYSQERIGLRGKRFTLYKFRTMRDCADGAFHSWSNGQDQQRVTRLGRFLRNSHLDELPQLINVLRGEMRLIGPRPEMLEIECWAEREVPGFSARLAVRPGITGLAQVVQGYTGRDTAAYERKLELCLAYLADHSAGLDLRILCWTVRDVLGRRGWRWKEDASRAARGERIGRRDTPQKRRLSPSSR
jgi:lipopolysaccharide/colanic/teichoic acid biosynthesis glycosyltransferase